MKSVLYQPATPHCGELLATAVEVAAVEILVVLDAFVVAVDFVVEEFFVVDIVFGVATVDEPFVDEVTLAVVVVPAMLLVVVVVLMVVEVD